MNNNKYSLTSLHYYTPHKKFKNDIVGMRNWFVDRGWKSSLYHMFKEGKFAGKVKAPFKSKYTIPYKNHGLMLIKTMLLCEKLHKYLPEKILNQTKYKTSLKWFTNILIESINLSKLSSESSNYKKIKNERHQLKLLRNIEYPINPYDELVEPELKYFIDVCFENLAKENIDKQYKEFLKSMQKWIDCRDSTHKDYIGWGAIFEECIVNHKKEQLKLSHHLSIKSQDGGIIRLASTHKNI